MKNFILLIILSFISLTLNAQKFEISGTVIDQETNQPLEYATIVLRPTNGDQVDGGLTDAEGKFNIDVKKGTYNISVEFISFESYKLPNKEITSNLNLGKIVLHAAAEALDEVEIIAEKTTVEIKLDKKIYNVGKDLTVRGGTVSDVLDNVPSVSVDVEGNVALRGNESVTILINGKPSGLVGLNSTDALRQLPADAIEKVEVITSPSARYNAEGTGGILNIILRRSKLQGFNGAITTNVGYPFQAGISGNINYRTGDFNFFNTTSYGYRESPGLSTTETQYFNKEFDDDGNLLFDNPDTFLNERRETERKGNSFNTNFGVEYYINESTSVTAAVLLGNRDSDSETTNSIKEYNANGDLIKESSRFDPENDIDKTTEFSFNFNKDFKTDGHKLTADFQYSDASEDENSLISEDGEDAEKVRTFEIQKEILIKTDYVLPIGEKSQFEFGYRGEFNDLDTDYTLAFNENGTFVTDTDVSNNLLYKENVNALYTQYGSKIKDKFSYLLGLRFETTDVTIDQRTSNDFQNQNYSGFFPTLNLGYELNEKQSLTFGYNRRIRRPRSRYINPFPSRSSATSLFQGNPNLKPSYSNSVDFGYLNRFGKLTLNSSIYYQKATDVFTFISEDTGGTATVGGTEIPVIRRTPINLATENRFGFEFTVTYRPTQKWNLNGNFNFFSNETIGEYNDVDYGANNLSWFVRLNNKVTLPAQIDWQTRLFYMGPTEDAQNIRKGMFSTDLAFSKDLFNERASITFNISDVFNSRKRSMESFTPTFNSDSEFQWRQRSFNLAFTYRFNQKKKRQEGRQEGFDDDEGFGG
ncbi:TonB-dependent receptor [Aureibaculum sp. 2210JD6-5]|uniref:TonB-dependent receptor domain-containing protein n=1 Tax=Aureibaculum sp. 2210JD6-5 TaxID=3103957 RepID=UPI002AAD9907|nr:TonB-dependent receptor [Aureibaculum sp. 2210JD6-5]MDY7393923.1 TonB-dependent receptor [Aureibaculum sp. 2210JD6-5]